MSDSKYYITTPLYYVNAKPHIGHAYTNILCDSFSKFHRLMGEDVFFMTGTDEHGTKIEKSAEEKGTGAQAYVDSIVPHFQHLWKSLGINYDYFIRTTDDSHKKTVQAILSELEAKGEIYKAKYEGWYSVKSETFYAENELVDGKCPDTGGDVQKIEEENYFFKMSKHQEWLIGCIKDNPEFIQPEKRRNEILGFLKEPLQDLCITRPKERLKWGIDYPGTDSHVVYVWFDALINYISGVGYKTDDSKFDAHWPVDVHVLGKDIIRHHAVYWPIMLKACELPMPKKLLVHGWWTISGEKVSKSSGNVIDPLELIAKYGVDAVRYFMLKEVTLGEDGAYSEELLRRNYRTELVNDLGNLWFRTASMLAKYFDKKIPAVEVGPSDEPLLGKTYELWKQVTEMMKVYDPKTALQSISNIIVQANVFVDEKKPWALAKDPEKKEELAKTLVTLLEVLAHVAFLLKPFIPETSEKILGRLGLETNVSLANEADYAKRLLQDGVEVDRGEVLFRGLTEIDEESEATK